MGNLNAVPFVGGQQHNRQIPLEVGLLVDGPFDRTALDAVGDGIGLGFDDTDIVKAGYDPYAHRRFLVDYFTGAYDASPARGRPFGVNLKTGDARISGTLASLAGLEEAIEHNDDEAIGRSIDLILLLHSMIMSLGGIPLLYYGDEIGMLNDFSYMEDEARAHDTRWIHRPVIDWNKSELRHRHGTPEQRLFEGIARMSVVRKTTAAFADFNNRELIATGNDHLFAFMRSNPVDANDNVLVIGNFDGAPQSLDLADLGNRSQFQHGRLRDLYSGEAPSLFKDHLVIPPRRFYWLVDQG